MKSDAVEVIQHNTKLLLVNATLNAMKNNKHLLSAGKHLSFV